MADPAPPTNPHTEARGQAAGESRSADGLERREWTARELAELRLGGFPTTDRSFRRWLQDRGVRSERRRVRGGEALVFRTSDLPPELQLALLQREAAAAVVDRGVAPAPAVDLAVACRDLVKLPTLSDAARERADTRWAAVLAYERWCRELGRKPSTKLADLFAEAWAQREIDVPEGVRAALPTFCGRSLLKWQRDMKAKGVVALAGGYTKPQRTIDKIAGMRDFAEALIAHKPSISGRLFREALATRFGDAVPSEDACRRWLSDWKQQNKSLHAHLVNPDAHKAKFMPAFGSASEAVTRLNQVWEFDATKADVMLADGQRYQLVAFIDIWSRRAMIRVHRTSSGPAVAGLLRDGILAFGVPERVHRDNGSDFTSQHVSAVLARLEIVHWRAQVGAPQQKPFIERFFRTFSHNLLTLLPGYVGHDVAERQKIESRKSFMDRLFKRRGDAQPVELRLTREELQDFCDKWCAGYHNQAHGGIGTTPTLKAASYSGEVRTIPDVRALDVLLEPIAGYRTVTKKGIRLERGLFIAPELGDWIDQRVECRQDSRDFGSIYVFGLDGQWICRAEDPERTGISREEVAEEAKRQAKAAQHERRGTLRAKSRREIPDSDRLVRNIVERRAASRVVAFPRPGVAHETGGLTEAGHASRADDAPKAPPRTEADARRAAKIDALAEQRRAEAARDPWAERQALIERLLAAWDGLKAGAVIAESERHFLARNEMRAEFLSALAMQRGVDIRRGHYQPIAARRAASA